VDRKKGRAYHKRESMVWNMQTPSIHGARSKKRVGEAATFQSLTDRNAYRLQLPLFIPTERSGYGKGNQNPEESFEAVMAEAESFGIQRNVQSGKVCRNGQSEGCRRTTQTPSRVPGVRPYVVKSGGVRKK